eukprot:g29551.t1
MVNRLKDSNTNSPEILDKYKDVFRGTLREMKEVEIKLQLKPDAHPGSLKISQAPYTIQPKVEVELRRLMNLDDKVLVSANLAQKATQNNSVMSRAVDIFVRRRTSHGNHPDLHPYLSGRWEKSTSDGDNK